MIKKYCIVIPIYKNALNKNEFASVKRTINVFKQDLFFVAPSGLKLDYYKTYFPEVNYIFFGNEYFKSTQTYSKLLLSEQFYDQFAKYEYMLIAQTDVMILGNKEQFEQYVGMGYDYWGAPWFEGLKINKFPYSLMNHLPKFIGKPKMCYVGNGGFCLRSVKASKELIRKHKIISKCWANEANEDCFFSYFDGQDYKLAPVEIAKKFALEDQMKEYLTEGNIPFAVHAWEKFYREDFSLIERFINYE